MTPEIFKSRKAFISDFIKDRVEFYFSECDSSVCELYKINETVYRTNYFNPEVYTLDFISEKIKPFYYYILSHYEKYALPCDITFKLKPFINDFGDDNPDFTNCDFYFPNSNYTFMGMPHFEKCIYTIKQEGFLTIPIFPFFFEMRIIEELKPVNKIKKAYKTDECVICLSSPPNIICPDCGHISTCENCEQQKEINICPACRTRAKVDKIQI